MPVGCYPLEALTPLFYCAPRNMQKIKRWLQRQATTCTLLALFVLRTNAARSFKARVNKTTSKSKF